MIRKQKKIIMAVNTSSWIGLPEAPTSLIAVIARASADTCLDDASCRHEA
jgi:hypothetical protein